MNPLTPNRRGRRRPGVARRGGAPGPGRPRGGLLTIFAVAAFLALEASAMACSCVSGSAKERLAESDVAFVATVESRREVGGGFEYLLRVDRVHKGALGERVAIRTARDGGTCGFDEPVGTRLAFVLHDSQLHEGAYRAGICDMVDERELEAAASSPFPRPEGDGVARLLVTGPFGDAGLAAYDGAGRLLAYAFDVRGEATDVCPRSRYAVVAGDELTVVRLRDMRPVRRVGLPEAGALAVRCLSPDGRRAVAAVAEAGTGARVVLVAVARDRVRVLRRASYGVPAIGRRFAYLPRNGRRAFRLERVDLRTGRLETVLRDHGAIGSVAVSPGERFAAAVGGTDDDAFLWVVDLRTRRHAARVIGSAEDAPGWLGDRRVALGRRIWDAGFAEELRPAGRLPSGMSAPLAVEGRRAWDIGARKRLLGARLGAGRARTLARLPDARLLDLDAISGGVRLRGASERAASPTRAPAGARSARAPVRPRSCGAPPAVA